MAENRKPSWRKARKAERNRNLLMVLIPLILVILAVVIILINRSGETKDKDDTAPATETVTAMTDGSLETDEGSGNTESADTRSGAEGLSDAETGESETSENPDSAAGQVFTLLKKDEIPQINDLMKTYWNARLNCDAEAIYKLYGKSDTNNIEKFRATLLLNARELQSIGSIACYTMEGMNDNSWIVYAVVELKLRQAEPMIPIGTKFYVTEDAEGTFTLVDPAEYTPELTAFIEQADKTEEVRNLSSQANKRTMEAVNSSPYLISLYGTLNAGSPLWATDETEPETEVWVITE